MNSKVFNRISRTNRTKHISQHETCTCKCRVDGSGVNNKQLWNKDKFRCECEELIDEGRWDEWLIWNPGNC